MIKRKEIGVTIGGTYFPTWKDAAKHFKLCRNTLKYRVKRGIPLDAPLNTLRTKFDTPKPYLFTKFPEVVQEWLLNTMPPNVTVSEFITAIVIDAYNDDGEPYGPITNHTTTTKEP